MRRYLQRMAALAGGFFGLAYIVTFAVVADTEHGNEPVSWPSAGVIAVQSIIPALMTLAVGFVIIGMVLLILWALDA